MIPFNVVMEKIRFTAQTQNELSIAQRELQKYKSLKLTSEQRKYLEGLVSFLINYIRNIKYFSKIYYMYILKYIVAGQG